MEGKTDRKNNLFITEEEIDKLYDTLDLSRNNYSGTHISGHYYSSKESAPKYNGKSYFGERTSNSSDFSKGPHGKREK